MSNPLQFEEMGKEARIRKLEAQLKTSQRAYDMMAPEFKRINEDRHRLRMREFHLERVVRAARTYLRLSEYLDGPTDIEAKCQAGRDLSAALDALDKETPNE